MLAPISIVVFYHANCSFAKMILEIGNFTPPHSLVIPYHREHRRSNMSHYYLSIDIGASSGRHILCTIQNGIIITEEIYRFANGAEEKDGNLCWNPSLLCSHIISGLKKAKDLNKIPETIAIDTWGVDFVLLDSTEQPIGNCISYRDTRTEPYPSRLTKIISKDALYQRTGIQEQPFNTIYQLMALQDQHPDSLEKAAHLLLMPDYFNWALTGIITNEYTNASTTNLVNLKTRNWDDTVIEKLSIKRSLFAKNLTQPGTTIGPLKEEIAQEIGYQANVITAASHDTASAFISIPAKGTDSLSISSGTWSLLGVENTQPITSQLSREASFTNEGGYNHTIRYLKNIMGLWMIQSCKKNWGSIDSYQKLEMLARQADPKNTTIIDVNDTQFLSPKSMVTAIKEYCRDHNLIVPHTKGEVMLTVYRSLAHDYKKAIDQLQTITGKHYQSINIVGGGSVDTLLNQMTSDATGLPVYAGPTEGTALGNCIVQLLAANEIENLTTARKIIRDSFEIKTFLPQGE